jgi:hypothetical protein
MKQPLFVLCFLLIACKGRPKFKIDTNDGHCREVVGVLSFSELCKNFKKYQGKYIETTGAFWYQFENVSLCADRDQNAKCFWLDIASIDANTDSTLTSASGFRVTVRGVVDTTSKGHLGYYLATLRDVDYLSAD